MERVTFMVEKTRQRIDCMLNPDSLVVERLAGIRPRRSTGGFVTGPGLTDDPLLYTGGGRTELKMDLLFDLSLLATPEPGTQDVRTLTLPLWNLAENSDDDGYGRPPLVRFVWGKSWNILGVVAAVSERLEYFDAQGAPRRSWLRLKLVRAANPSEGAPEAEPLDAGDVSDLLDQAQDASDSEVQDHAVLGGRAGDLGSGERLDVLADRYYGDPGMWKVLALFNDVDDPAELRSGQVLRIPPIPGSGGASA